MLLKEYLLNILQLELSLEDQTRAISDAKRTIDTVSPELPPAPKKPGALRAPEKQKPSLSKPNPPGALNLVSLLGYAFSALAVSAFAGWMIKLMIDLFATFGKGRWNTLYVFFLFIAVPGSVFLAGVLITTTVGMVGKAKQDRQSYPDRLRAYESEQASIEKKYQEVFARYEKDAVNQERTYQREVENHQRMVEEIRQTTTANKNTARKAILQMESEKKATDAVLKQYYSLGIVHPKYRNVSALTAICEYLDTGRCTGLTGPDGAYNLYEMEHRQDLIIHKLDVVINKLEKIERNQVLMLKQLQKIRNSSSAMASDMKKLLTSNRRIEAFSGITAYCSAVTAINTAATAYFTSQIAQNTADLKYIALGK